MRFLFRSLTGLFITALTVGLLTLAAAQLWQALETRRAGPGAARPAVEQVYTTRLMTVTPVTVAPVMQVFGTIRSRRELQLRAGAPGRIMTLDPDMHEGGQVTAGQVLAEIDPADAVAARDTAAAARNDAVAAVTDARSAVDIARDDLAAAEEQAVLRREALERQRQLAERNLGTRTERESAELAVSAADQAVLSRRSALANAESAVASAESALARAEIALTQADRAVADTRVIAGFDGRLTQITAVQGALVGQNEQIGLLIDPDALEVQIPLSLDQFARLVAGKAALDGTPVSVVLDGSAGRITAAATLDRAAASVAEGEAGRTVYAAFDAADARLRPGDFVTVEIAEPALTDAAVIPSSAVGADGAVLVLGGDDRLTALRVDVLRRQGDDMVIAVPEDLAGAQIVAERAPQLGAGIRVRDSAAPAPEAAPTGQPADPVATPAPAPANPPVVPSAQRGGDATGGPGQARAGQVNG